MSNRSTYSPQSIQSTCWSTGFHSRNNIEISIQHCLSTVMAQCMKYRHIIKTNIVSALMSRWITGKFLHFATIQFSIGDPFIFLNPFSITVCHFSGTFLRFFISIVMGSFMYMPFIFHVNNYSAIYSHICTKYCITYCKSTQIC